MKTQTYPVFVDRTTADRLKITEAEGRPLDDKGNPLGGDGVYVGECEPVTTYESWDEVPEVERADVLLCANRQRIQDAKNLTRADVKGGGTLTLAAQLKAEMLKITTPGLSHEEYQKIGAEIGRLNAEITDAKLKK